MQYSLELLRVCDRIQQIVGDFTDQDWKVHVLVPDTFVGHALNGYV